jgi:hypothetical protein
MNDHKSIQNQNQDADEWSICPPLTFEVRNRRGGFYSNGTLTRACRFLYKGPVVWVIQRIDQPMVVVGKPGVRYDGTSGMEIYSSIVFGPLCTPSELKEEILQLVYQLDLKAAT